MPKKSDFNKISDNELKVVVEEINDRPRKTLGYKTPNEVFFALTNQGQIIDLNLKYQT